MARLLLSRISKKYGPLTVKSYAGDSRWLCQCECGNSVVVRGHHLARPGLLSCGFACPLFKAASKSRNQKHFLQGKVFGSWTVLGLEAGRWACECACGRKATRTSRELLRIKTVSGACRCRRYKHGGRTGDKASAEYQAWKDMRSRCYRVADASFHSYGARGVEVCRRWNRSFSAFFNDMGRKPSPDTSLDRIDNINGHYSCGRCGDCVRKGRTANCRWATRTVQNTNKRPSRKKGCGEFNVLITLQGTSKTVREWAMGLGIHPATLCVRLKNWPSLEDALTRPRKKDSRKTRYSF